MTIFRNEYNSNISRQFTWLIFIVVITAMFMLAFPVINDGSVAPIIQTSLNNLPEKLTNVLLPFGINTFSNLELYYNSILVFTQFMICLFALNIGILSIAKEQGFGTIDYLYIDPISRGEIVLNKILSNILSLIILVLLTYFASSYIFSYVAKLDYIEVLKDYYLYFIVILVEALLFLALGNMISSFSKRTSSLSTVMSLIIIALLSLNIVISLDLLNIGEFAKFVPFRTLQSVSFESIVSIIITLIISKVLLTVLFWIISFIHFNRKDLIV